MENHQSQRLSPVPCPLSPVAPLILAFSTVLRQKRSPTFSSMLVGKLLISAWSRLASLPLAWPGLALLQIEEKGALDLVRAAMSDFPSDGSVWRASLSLLRNMCANDDFKAKLVSEGGLQLILAAMSQHREDALLQVRRHR